MAIQQTNDSQIDLLSPHFVRTKLPLMIYGDFSGFAIVEVEDIDTTAQVIISDSDYDVRVVLRYTAAVRESTGGVNTATGQLVPGGTANIYSDGVDTCQLRLNIDGSLDVRRTAGAATFNVHLMLNWI